MKSFYVALLLGVLAVGVLSSDFEAFRSSYKRSYGNSSEIAKRKAIFEKNIKRIEALNAEAKKNNEDVVYKLNKFADLEKSEFVNKYCGFKKSKGSRQAVNLDSKSTSTTDKKADTGVFGKQKKKQLNFYLNVC